MFESWVLEEEPAALMAHLVHNQEVQGEPQLSDQLPVAAEAEVLVGLPA
jgi:hypothetical protein